MCKDMPGNRGDERERAIMTEKTIVEQLCDWDLALRGEGPDRNGYVVVVGDNKKPDLAVGAVKNGGRERQLPMTFWHKRRSRNNCGEERGKRASAVHGVE